ncbi:hypothetical protein F5Y10DRAFT_92070 [Nemania abortiva]|nr:hypothetical protein F5Y10DRAFT_92070 [Nemania abortiva]
MQRRSAKKSRHGCKECKRRHVKCDETRPSCANCNVRHLQCSYLSSLPLPRRSTSSSSSSNISSPNSSVTSGPPQSDNTAHHQSLATRGSDHATFRPATALSQCGPTFAINPLFSIGQTFQLHHLELLHNFRTGVLGDIFLDTGAADGYMAMTVGEAIRAPYLMDQALAVSAANFSIKRSHQRHFYQDEATHLQTRGLALFNAAQASEATDNALASFVFSTLLSQQVLFDAFLTRTDFSTFLDKLATSLHICGGVRTMTAKAWPFIRTQYQQQTGINLPGEFMAGSGSETMLTTKLAHLETLLADASLSPSILNPCMEALGLLRDLSYIPDRPRDSAFRTTRMLQTRVIQWAVQVPTEFVNLLEQRRPEALIITTYYALLIHDTRDFWLYGDAGAFIIRSITAFLGKYWAEWLAWPNEVVESVTYDDANTSFPYEVGDRQTRINELP